MRIVFSVNMDKVESTIIHVLTAKGFGILIRINVAVVGVRQLLQQALEPL